MHCSFDEIVASSLPSSLQVYERAPGERRARTELSETRKTQLMVARDLARVNAADAGTGLSRPSLPTVQLYSSAPRSWLTSAAVSSAHAPRLSVSPSIVGVSLPVRSRAKRNCVKRYLTILDSEKPCLL